MAKKTEAEKQAEEAALAARNEETMKAAATIGRDDSDWEAGAAEVDDVFKSIPSFTPGKPGFDKEGEGFTGTFVRTKRVVSDKLTGGKVDPVTHERYRNLHIFSDKNNVQFGIWGVGGLDAAMRCVRPGSRMKIIYDGLGEPLKAGQDAPHTFKYKGTTPDGQPLVFDWDSIENATRGAQPAPAANQVSARQ